MGTDKKFPQLNIRWNSENTEERRGKIVGNRELKDIRRIGPTEGQQESRTHRIT